MIVIQHIARVAEVGTQLLLIPSKKTARHKSIVSRLTREFFAIHRLKPPPTPT